MSAACSRVRSSSGASGGDSRAVSGCSTSRLLSTSAARLRRARRGAPAPISSQFGRRPAQLGQCLNQGRSIARVGGAPGWKRPSQMAALPSARPRAVVTEPVGPVPALSRPAISPCWRHRHRLYSSVVRHIGDRQITNGFVCLRHAQRPDMLTTGATRSLSCQRLPLSKQGAAIILLLLSLRDNLIS